MTTNYDNLTDEALSALIAEQVMGIKLGGKCACDCGNAHDESGIYIKRYSTDISAAFTVVEKFRLEGWMVSVNCSSDQQNGWWVCMYPRVGDHIDGIYAETATKAICLAALAVVEGKE